MNIAFAGTPEFARVALAALFNAGHAVSLVLTQPDRPAERGLQLQQSPVKQEALMRGMAVSQPQGLRLDGKYADDAQTVQATLQAADPDVLIVAAYGLILPGWVLALPKWGCVNIHASLLPRWRGAAPIHRAIEAGDTATGITLMQMDQGLDTGGIIAMRSLPLSPADTTAVLHDRLAGLGGEMIVALMNAASKGLAWSSAPQPAEGVSYAAKIDKTERRIDWREPAEWIARRARAFDPFPGLQFALPASSHGPGAEPIKLWAAEAIPGQGVPG